MQTWWRSANELDDDQRSIMALPPDGSFALRGPPGSGKTNLLLMRAAYLSTLRRNIAVVVLNRNLAEFIRSGAQAYGLDPRCIVTIRSLASSMAREAGIKVPDGRNYADTRIAILETLKSIYDHTRSPIYDAIFVDEAQDHSNDDLIALRKLSRDFFLTTDSRQMIYEGGIAADAFPAVVDEIRTLRFHYRSSPEVCDLADAIGNTFSSGYERIAPTSRYPLNGPRESVRLFQGSLRQQATEIGTRLQGQIRVYRGQLLGVIAPRKDDVAIIAEELRGLGLDEFMTVQTGDEGYLPFDPLRPICVSTVHGAKGLEFQAVHFAAAEAVRSSGSSQKRLAFTAITRAKSSLSIYHDDLMPGYLNSAVASVQPDNEETDWTRVFNAGT